MSPAVSVSPEGKTAFSGWVSFDHQYGWIIAVLILTPAMIWSGYCHWTGPIVPFDDAFITYRYVLNAIDGKGLVYNPGEHVLGVSSPLYLLLLVALKTLLPVVAIPVLAIRLNACCYLLAGGLVYTLLRGWSGRTIYAALGGALLMIEPTLLSWSMGGMESSLFLALACLALWVAVKQKPGWCGALAALACLTRPEGLLILLAASGLFWRQGRKLAVLGTVFAITLAPWLLFCWMYYGSVIPLSITAKNKPLYPLPPFYDALKLNHKWVNWSLGKMTDDEVQLAEMVNWILLVASVLSCLIYRPGRAGGRWLPSALFAGFLVLYGIGNPLLLEWYLPAVFIFAAMSVLLGIPLWGELLRDRCQGTRYRFLASGVMGITILTPLALCLYPIVSHWSQGHTPRNLIENSPNIRIRAYQQAAEWLNTVAAGDDAVSAPEIGALGFYCRKRILDACGLVSPEALPFLPVPPEQRLNYKIGAISADFVLQTKPRFVVTMPIFANLSLYKSEPFLALYEPVKTIPLPFVIWTSDQVVIFQRKPGCGGQSK